MWRFRRVLTAIALSASLLAGCTTVAPTPPPHVASVAFREDPDLLRADFDVIGLPAVDTSNDAIVVADLSHGEIASSLELSLHWLVPEKKEPVRTVVVLGGSEASHVLYEIDEPDQPAAMAILVPKVRARTDGVNALLASKRLRPTIACTVQSPKAGVGCVHPQRLTCGAHTFELDRDRIGDQSLGWTPAPMSIGDGPPKEMVTCIEEAHLDERRMRLVARIETSCKGGGSDACYLSPEWRVVNLR